jgi:hypothetical protein
MLSVGEIGTSCSIHRSAKERRSRPVLVARSSRCRIELDGQAGNQQPGQGAAIPAPKRILRLGGDCDVDSAIVCSPYSQSLLPRLRSTKYCLYVDTLHGCLCYPVLRRCSPLLLWLRTLLTGAAYVLQHSAQDSRMIINTSQEVLIRCYLCFGFSLERLK